MRDSSSPRVDLSKGGNRIQGGENLHTGDAAGFPATRKRKVNDAVDTADQQLQGGEEIAVVPSRKMKKKNTGGEEIAVVPTRRVRKKNTRQHANEKARTVELNEEERVDHHLNHEDEDRTQPQDPAFERNLKAALTLTLNSEFYDMKFNRPVAPLTEVAIRAEAAKLQSQRVNWWSRGFEKLVQAFVGQQNQNEAAELGRRNEASDEEPRDEEVRHRPGKELEKAGKELEKAEMEKKKKPEMAMKLWRVSAGFRSGEDKPHPAGLVPRVVFHSVVSGSGNRVTWSFWSALAAEFFLDSCSSEVPLRREYRLWGTGLQGVARLLDVDSLINSGRLVYVFGPIDEARLLEARDRIKIVVMLPCPSLDLVVESEASGGSVLGYFPVDRSWSRAGILPEVFRYRFREQQAQQCGAGEEEEEGGSSAAAMEVREMNSRTLTRVFGPEQRVGELIVFRRTEVKPATHVFSTREMKPPKTHREMKPAKPRKGKEQKILVWRPSGTAFSRAEAERVKGAVDLFNEEKKKAKVMKTAKGKQEKMDPKGKGKGNPKNHAFTFGKRAFNESWSEEEQVMEFIGHTPGVEVGNGFADRGQLVAVRLHMQTMRGIAYIELDDKKWKVVANSVVDSISQFEDGPTGFVYRGSNSEKDNASMKNSCRLNVPVRVISKETGEFVYKGLHKVTRFWEDSEGFKFLLERCGCEEFGGKQYADNGASASG